MKYDPQAVQLITELKGREDQIPNKKIAIISSQRSGSTLFCAHLEAKCGLPYPIEWFNKKYLRAYCLVFNTEHIILKNYVDFILRKATRMDGYFTVKIQMDQYINFKEFEYDLLDINFDHIYGVYRSDKLAQGLSLAKANVTGEWNTALNIKKDDQVINKIKFFNVLEQVRSIAFWDYYFENTFYKLVEKLFCYEEFENDTNVLNDYLERLVVPGYSNQGKMNTKIQKQREQTDIEYIEQLKRYLQLS